jgi:DNA-binding NtrC family response regulator
MDLSVQLKILKVLEQRRFQRLGSVQERYVDTRIIASSQKNVEKLVRQGYFREDLFHRLITMKMDLPALRDRKEDIIPLSEFLLNQISRDKTAKSYALTENAKSALRSYSWPGNIRELRNILERAILLSPDRTIHAGQLSIQAKIALSDGDVSVPLIPLREMERKYITQALASVNNNYSKAAEILKVNRNTLYNRLRDKKKVTVE